MTYRPQPSKHATRLQKLANTRRHHGTLAEIEFERILNELNAGALRGRFQREWAYGGRWIIDFYFHEIRMGIEVEGGYHQSLKQQLKDIERELAIEQAGITILRIANEEVFGDRETLLNKLRTAWRKAQQSSRSSTALRKSSPHQRLPISNQPLRRKGDNTKPYTGGWTSLKQGDTKIGDAFNKVFVDEGIAGTRDEHRANAKRNFLEIKKRSRGE